MPILHQFLWLPNDVVIICCAAERTPQCSLHGLHQTGDQVGLQAGSFLWHLLVSAASDRHWMSEHACYVTENLYMFLKQEPTSKLIITAKNGTFVLEWTLCT